MKVAPTFRYSFLSTLDFFLISFALHLEILDHFYRRSGTKSCCKAYPRLYLISMKYIDPFHLKQDILNPFQWLVISPNHGISNHQMLKPRHIIFALPSIDFFREYTNNSASTEISICFLKLDVSKHQSLRN